MPENCEKNGCGALDALTDRVSELEKRNGEDHKRIREDFHGLELKFSEQKGQLSAIMSTLTEVKMDSKNIIERLTNFTGKVDKVDGLVSDVKKLDDEIDAINSKSGKKWDSISGKVLEYLVLAVLGAALLMMGLKG